MSDTKAANIKTMQDGIIVTVAQQDVIHEPYISLGVWDTKYGNYGFSGFLTPAQALKVAAELISHASAMLDCDSPHTTIADH